MSAFEAIVRPDIAKTAYRGPDGRRWAYSGKRAVVLDMLVERAAGITQWDTLPWHTRLGGTIHAFRRDGLEISTEIEGKDRHARYRICVRLVSDKTPDEHRTAGLKNNHRNSSGGPAG